MHEIERVLKAASWRLFVVDLARTGVVTATIAISVLLILRLAEKLFPIEFDWQVLFGSAAGAAALVALLWAYLRRFRGLGLAREVDERAGLREALSTALIVDSRTDGWSRAVVETAREQARRIVIKDAVPFERPRAWQAPTILAVGLLAVWWLPRYDLTGLIAREKQEEQQQQVVQQVMSEIKLDQDKLAEMMKKAGIEEGLGDLEPPADAQKADPKKLDDIRREALRKLTNLNEQLQDKAKGEEGKQLEAMKHQLRQLRTPGEGPMSEFSRQLARSNFAEARKKLEEFAEQLAEDKLTPEQKQAAADQLENLKQQLEQLAQNQSQLEQALQQAGMTAEQAKQAASSPENMQHALQQMQNMSEEQKQQLQQLAQAQSKAGEACSGMSAAMGQMAQAMSQNPQGQQGEQGQQGQQGGQSGQQGQQSQAGQGQAAAGALAGQLSSLEAMQQASQNLQAAMSECQSQMQQLGQSMSNSGSPGQCFGNGQSPFAEGDSSHMSNGQGNPGKGSGGAMDSTPTDFALEQVKENVKNQGGPIINETIIYGSQIRGESTATFKAAVAQATAKSSEEIQNKAIPKEYEAAVQHYFGRLKAVVEAKHETPPAEEGSAGSNSKDSSDQ